MAINYIRSRAVATLSAIAKARGPYVMQV